MRKVWMLLGVAALASPAWADDAVPQTATDAAASNYAPAPYVIEDEATFSDAWTASGEAGDSAGPACFCANNNGRARCLRDASCNNPPCQNGQCPQGMACWVDSCCGAPVCVPDDCTQDPACQQPGTCGNFVQCSDEPPQAVKFFRDPREFAIAVEQLNKRNKGVENFEESTTGPNSGVPIDDPLEGGVPKPPHFPNGLAIRNLRVQANTLGGNPVNPSPHGVGGLAHFTPPAANFTTKVIIANFFVDSLDLIFKPDQDCECKTAIAGNTVRFSNAGASDIRVYDVNNNLIGQLNGVPNDPAGTNFIGMISNGPCIGRVNLFDPGNGAEGLDNIQMWCAGGENTCKYSRKVKAKGGCQACPTNLGCVVDSGIDCGSLEDCRKKVKENVPCPNGPGKCKITHKRCACD